jgi:hypothetical protein
MDEPSIIRGSSCFYLYSPTLRQRMQLKLQQFAGDGGTKTGAAHRKQPQAERVGFEPTVATRTTAVFETAPFVHSGTSPRYREL